MKITVFNKDKSLSPILKLYLIACVAVSRFPAIIVTVFILGLNLLKRLVIWLFQPRKIIFFTIPAIVAGLIFNIWHLTSRYNTDLLARKKLNLFSTYEFLNKQLPAESLQAFELTCNEEGMKINLGSRKRIYRTNISLRNNSKVPILLRAGGKKYAIKVRPRLWDANMEKVVKDGIPIYLKLGNAELIEPNSIFESNLGVRKALIVDVPKTAKFLVFGIVQEGVAWAPTKSCKFELIHA